MSTKNIESKKSEYQRPKLVVYGNMVSLTAAGSGGVLENVSGQGATSKKA